MPNSEGFRHKLRGTLGLCAVGHLTHIRSKCKNISKRHRKSFLAIQRLNRSKRARRRSYVSSFAVEVGPFAGLDKAGPIEGMLTALTLHHRQLGLAQSLAAAEAFLQPRIVFRHQFAGDVVADGPEAHYQGFRAGQEERAAQSVNPFTIPDLAYARVTSRERHELRTPEIQVGSLQGGEDATSFVAFRDVGAAQRQT